MKKLFLLVQLLLPFLLFSQSWDYRTLTEYKEWEKLVESFEYENKFLCTNNYGVTESSFWSGNQNDCNNTNYSSCETALRKGQIGRLNKSDFNKFEEMVLQDLPTLFQGYSEKYSWKNQFKIGIDKINFEFETGDTGRRIAWAHSPLQGDIRIIINIDKWEELNNYERVYLLLHEFGHEAFGMEHGDNILMYPLIPEKLKYDGRYNILKEKSKLAYIKKAEAFAETMNSLEAREIFMKKVKYKVDNEFGNYIEEFEEFGRGYNFEGDSSKVPIAFNILFEALNDFYKFISDNLYYETSSHDIFIMDTNKVIGTIKINKFSHLKK